MERAIECTAPCHAWVDKSTQLEELGCGRGRCSQREGMHDRRPPGGRGLTS